MKGRGCAQLPVNCTVAQQHPSPRSDRIGRPAFESCHRGMAPTSTAAIALFLPIAALLVWWRMKERQRGRRATEFRGITQDPPGFYRSAQVRISELERLVATRICMAAFPLGTEVVQQVVIFERDALLESASAEQILAATLHEGPGVFVIRGAFASPEELAAIDAATAAFDAIIAKEEAAACGDRGDHFAPAGANSRIWNALEKLAVTDPDAFVRYYGNPAVALACRAWLGPNYQMTSQVNVVRPGGTAQHCHRDYHLGFQTDAAASHYPAHVHKLAPMLTLQGAIAHVAMPIESGPTRLLPHSQKFDAGYVAWRREDVKALFEDSAVQIPLLKGDALFFNPALIHAAGANTSTSIQRMVNLLQVSSAFGRSMETVDRHRVSLAIYPALLRACLDEAHVSHAIASCAEGYPFPTNLDRDQPLDGLAPPSQAEVLTQAVHEQWEESRLQTALEALARRHRSV